MHRVTTGLTYVVQYDLWLTNFAFHLCAHARGLTPSFFLFLKNFKKNPFTIVQKVVIAAAIITCPGNDGCLTIYRSN